MILFYDTETSGLPLFREPSEDPRQPHIVQLAASLCDEEMVELAQIDRIIRPDGWTIPEEVAAVHGITTERAMDEGAPERDVLDELLELAGKMALRVAHNESFDARIVRIALMRFHGQERAEAWSAGKAYCTMKACTDICKLPPTQAMLATGRKWFKSPKLEEAYRHFFGEGFDGAHSALADVRACMRVYRELEINRSHAA